MTMLITLAQVKSQLEDQFVDTTHVTRFIDVVNRDDDLFLFVARELSTSRDLAKELLIGALHKHPGLEARFARYELERFFELYPELETWYADPQLYIRYRE